MTDAEFLLEVKRSIHEIDPLAEVWLFGSRARDDSDWDFLVLTDEPANWTFKSRLRDHLYDVGFNTNHVISTVIQSRKQTPFLTMTDLYQNVMEEGVRL